MGVLTKVKNKEFFVFQLFDKMIETLFDTKLKIIHSDNGGEYISRAFSSFLSSHGILRHTKCPHTSENNGMAERKNRHLLEVTHALLFRMKVPMVFWADALLIVTYLINKLPTQVASNVPSGFSLYIHSISHSL